MPFLPNNPNALNAAAEDVDQTELDSVHLDIVLAAARGDGVLAGCAVTAQGSPDMTVAVASGTAQIGGAAVTVTSGNLTIGANAATWPRYDLIVVNSSGVKSVESGAAYANASNQVFPPIPANSVAFAAVRVIPSATTITGGKITDLRAFVRTSPVLNVKDAPYNATGDGVTDDAAAIQACIDAAMTTGAYASVIRTGLATVFFPPGTYRINTPLRVRSVMDFQMTGSGMASKIMAGAASMECLLDLNGVAWITLRDIGFTGGGGFSCTRAVWLRWNGTARSTSSCFFENLTVRDLNFSRAAFEAGDTALTNVQVDNTMWVNCYVYGGYIVGSGNTTTYQAGFILGEGAHGNDCVHELYGCRAAGARYGFWNNASTAIWVGGSFTGNEIDVYAFSAGYTATQGWRSEGSARLLETAGGGYASSVSLSDINWVPNAMHADTRIIAYRSGGTLRISNLTVPNISPFTPPSILMDNAVPVVLDINGMTSSAYPGGLITKVNSGALRTFVHGYTRADNDGVATESVVQIGGRLDFASNDLAAALGYMAFTPTTATFALGAGDIAGLNALQVIQGDSAGIEFRRPDGPTDFKIYRSGATQSGLYFWDPINNRGHIYLAQGASDNSAETYLSSTLYVRGDKITVGGDVVVIQTGTGAPENAYNGSPGSLYLRKTGGAGTSLYVKESGTGATGWVPYVTGGGATTLDGLSDVAITSPAAGHVLAHNGTTFRNRTSPVLNVKDFGATGDGTTDDTAAIQAVPDGAIHFFPVGNYLLSGSGIIPTTSHRTYRGAGKGRTRLFATTAVNALINSSASYPGLSNVVFEDMDFDIGTLGVTVASVYGAHLNDITFRRCRILNLPGTGLLFDGMSNVTVEDCDFTRTDGLATGTAVTFAGGGRDNVVRRNRFEWLYNAVLADTGAGGSPGEGHLELRVEDNYFDGWWWLRPVLGSNAGSGGTVTYTATTVVDTAANFPALTATSNDIRVLPTTRSGTISAGSTATKFVDTGATFVTVGARRGHVLRTATAWTVVQDVESQTVLRIEGWRSLTPATWSTPVAPPATSTAYTLHAVYLGRPTGTSTATSITVDRWRDLDGYTVTPSNGLAYELLVAHPNYHILLEGGVTNSFIRGNRIRRGWSDQINVSGRGNQVTGNIIEDGQDMGITLESADTAHDNIVAGNHIKHQGIGGIWCKQDESVVTGNHITATPWLSDSPEMSPIFVAGNNNLVGGNVLTRDIDGGQERQGITLSYGSTGCLIEGNRIVGYATADISVIDDASYTLGVNTIRHDGPVVTDGASTAQMVHLTGSGSPEGVVKAGVGSTFTRTNGAAGTIRYDKETGTGNTGWVASGAAATERARIVVAGDGGTLWPDGFLISGSYSAAHETLTGTAAFDATQAPYGGGSIRATAAYTIVQSKFLVAIDPSVSYSVKVMSKATAAGEDVAPGIQPLDIDGNTVVPMNAQRFAGSAVTTLAAQLNPSDTTITLTDGSTWATAAASDGDRSLAWWPYTAATGLSYPVGDYTRNTLWNAWASRTGNVLTLAVPWAGPTLAAGTSVANHVDGGTFMYATYTDATTSWAEYSGTIAAVDHYNGSAMRYGTAFVRPIVLLNYAGGTSHWVAGMRLDRV